MNLSGTFLMGSLYALNLKWQDGIDPLAVIKERVLISERERLEMEQKQKLVKFLV